MARKKKAVKTVDTHQVEREGVLQQPGFANPDADAELDAAQTAQEAADMADKTAREARIAARLADAQKAADEAKAKPKGDPPRPPKAAAPSEPAGVWRGEGVAPVVPATPAAPKAPGGPAARPLKRDEPKASAPAPKATDRDHAKLAEIMKRAGRVE